MKVYAIRQQIGSDNERITGIFTDEEQAKKYAKKSFKDYGDWGNRAIKLEDFDIYDKLTVRRRDLWNEVKEDDDHNVSIELWVKEGKRYEFDDREIVLSRDNAMVLATKLMRAVAELDADEYTSDLRQTVEILQDIAGDKFDKAVDRLREHGLYEEAKGGIMGAIDNFAKTPMGKDAVRKMKECK